MYMDDGIILGNTEEEMSERISKLRTNMASIGVEIAENKSKWLKRGGQWVEKRAKFLGLEYLAEENNIRAQTRNGATLKFPAKANWQERLRILSMTEVLKAARSGKRAEINSAEERGLLVVKQTFN